ncbi:alpha/beta fold hydrolase [Pseudoalteromonas sp. SSDWG2]|uniref:alpha/beta fold hydrolase n=1 Tax=Pseudoalteromonas sp. SSDWG2 TaxID=3139391 RepID=UPI003BA8EAF4
MYSFSIKTRNLELKGLANTPTPIGSHEHDIVIALHGWQDNAASFAPLMSSMPNDIPMYAFDWPGHGGSDWRGDDAHYYFVDYVDDLNQVIEQLSAKRIHLVGHSMGAMVASLFCACFADKVASLTLIEGIGLLSATPVELKSLLQRALVQRGREAKMRVYDSEHALICRREAVSDFDYDIAAQLMQRNIAVVANGVTLTTDPKIKHYSAFRFSESQAHALLDDICIPTLFIKGIDGYQQVKNNEVLFSHHYSNLSVQSIDGGHHCHMQNGAQCARLIGAHLRQNGAR